MLDDWQDEGYSEFDPFRGIVLGCIIGAGVFVFVAVAVFSFVVMCL